MGTVFGYARVSTKDQNSDAQEEALRRAGCSRIYRDIASGTLSERSGLEQCLEDLSEGDALVVWKLDRFRSVTATSCPGRDIVERQRCWF